MIAVLATLSVFASLVVVVWFVGRNLHTHDKEPTMHPTATPYHAAQRRHGRLARAAQSLYRAPVSIPYPDDVDDLSCDFVALDARKARTRIKIEAYAAQEVIAWRDLTDAEIEILTKWPETAMHPNRVAKRAKLALWKRAVRAAKRGGS